MQCMEVWGGNRAADQGVVMPGLDAWVYSRPHANADRGGDVHLVSSCATGRITRLLVADIAGHGDDLDAPAQRLRTLLRRYSNYVDQSAFLRELNRAFVESEDVGLFATAIAATFWAPTGYLTLCNAGHPRPLHYKAKTGQWAPIVDEGAAPGTGISNLPIGIDAPTIYEPFYLRLQRDDLVLIYTDAIIEARDARGAMIGEAGLLEIARGVEAASPQAFLADLLGQVRGHCGGSLPDDDLTLLLLRRNALSAGSLPLRDRLRGAWRFAKLFGTWILGGPTPPWPEFRAVNILGYFFSSANRRWGGP